MTTTTENVASFGGVPYLEFSAPTAYANYQQKAKRKCKESRIEKSYSRLNPIKLSSQNSYFPKEVIFFSQQSTKDRRMI